MSHTNPHPSNDIRNLPAARHSSIRFMMITCGGFGGMAISRRLRDRQDLDTILFCSRFDEHSVCMSDSAFSFCDRSPGAGHPDVSSLSPGALLPSTLWPITSDKADERRQGHREALPVHRPLGPIMARATQTPMRACGATRSFGGTGG